MIDTIPDRSLPAIKPLLTFLAEDYWNPVIEPASPEEKAIIEAGEKEYREHPETFVALESIR
jgi:hypothetical protein